MRAFARVVLFLLPLSASLAVAAESAEKFKLIEVSQLEGLLKQSPKPVTVLDANDAEFREKNGIIKGAKLLSSFYRYDVKTELPPDKAAPLVFYCSDRL